MKKRREDLLELMQEFEETNCVTRICPICNEDCEVTEIDSDCAFCPNCDKTVNVSPII